LLESTEDRWTSQDTERIRVSKGYSLAREHRQTSQNMKGIQVSKGHSLAREHEWMDKLGHRKDSSELEALTNWRVQIDRQVRIWKGSK
jgi:hypothetical protein